jgi:phosphatidylinositol alpha-1,6-mannosyltransferase
LARHLTQRGWELRVFARQDYASPEEVASFNQAQPFSVVSVESALRSPTAWIRRWRQVSAIIREWAPDLIVASGNRAVWLGSTLAQRYGIPCVAVGHGTEFGVPGSVAHRLTRWSIRRTTAVICVSEYTRKFMHAAGFRPRVAHVISNGGDPQRFRVLAAHEVEAFRSSLGLDGAKLILTVGNVTERKGQEVVIRALPHINAAIGDTHYLMAGLPTQEKKLQGVARDMGVADRVHFLGRVDDETLVRLFNACDLFAMTSRETHSEGFEGYGIAVVEAALCGVPAVVSQNSGLSEAISDGVTGIAVPEGDASATAEAIVTLLRDEETRRRMGRAARERAIRDQTWERRIESYDNLLRDVVRPSRDSRTYRVPAR